MRASTKVLVASFVAVLLSSGLASGTAEGASLTVTLERLTLTNVDDAAGVWQHEGGRVLLGGVHVANYAAHRRVTLGGTIDQNTAMLTLTIFVLGTLPPENVTIQGSHDYSSGRYIGSISAASASLRYLIGASVSGATSTGLLTITWGT